MQKFLSVFTVILLILLVFLEFWLWIQMVSYLDK